MFRKLALLSTFALGVCGGAASAQEAPKPFYIHIGPGDVILDAGAKLSEGGQVIPGATVSANNSVTAVVEVGYHFTPNWAVSFTGGYPPTARIQTAGTIAGLGEAGKAVYGPMALTLHYHFLGFGRFQPYIGGGGVFMHVFSVTDGVFTDLHVSDHFGYLGQVGADYLISDKWGAFVDFKKAHLRTSSSGMFGGALITGAVKLDPAVVHGGVSYRF